MRIQQFEKYLVGCRFCTMCTPYGEVRNLKQDEPHSTRIRALILWRILKGHAEWNEDVGKLLYESTLDSVSQSWCISDYPVPEYILAARADIFDTGLAPESVTTYTLRDDQSFRERLSPYAKDSSEIVFYPGDALAAKDVHNAQIILELLKDHDQEVALPSKIFPSGGIAHCLGRHDLVGGLVEEVIEDLRRYSKILVDGPLTFWMLSIVYPNYGIHLPEGVEIQGLHSYLLDLLPDDVYSVPSMTEKTFLVGSEFSRLQDLGYEPFWKLLQKVQGLDLIEPDGGLDYADSSGVGGALHISFPELAQRVSLARIDEACQVGADFILCDSPLDAAHLRQVSNGRIKIKTVPELFFEE